MDIVIINKNKPHVLVLLILLIASSVAEKTSVVEGRTLSLKPLQEYSKNLASLGVVCKCCDGDGEPQLFIFSNFSLEHPKLLSTVTYQAFLRILFQNRRNVRPAVIFLLDRTEFGSELTKWKLLSEPEGRTLLEVESKPCIWEYTAIQDACNYTDSYSPDGRSSIDGGASLEEVLEEENLEDANLVDVEVKAEP
ncbi:hypothetical protein LR48_Vigan661s003900 [Vigna angularis]|uniref:Uncharacterized protein n=1 Tax=Phaseolus angularis TaxID=3914 RepID=A0A0L9TG23_PHAAN|nr:hypothetical protein LR48_Vigan661s003900 [Vigna angularis]